MTCYKPVSTPRSTSYNSQANASEMLSPSAVTFLRSTLGALQYLTTTRPDLTFYVNLLSQFMHSSSVCHKQAGEHIFHDVKGTVNFGIQILSQSSLKFI